MTAPTFKKWSDVPSDFSGKLFLHDNFEGKLVEMWVKPGRIRHREDGFAIIHNDGTKYWMTNDKVHRLDGPAVICNDKEEFWINNYHYHEYVFWKHSLVIEHKLNKILGV